MTVRIAALFAHAYLFLYDNVTSIWETATVAETLRSFETNHSLCIAHSVVLDIGPVFKKKKNILLTVCTST